MTQMYIITNYSISQLLAQFKAFLWSCCREKPKNMVWSLHTVSHTHWELNPACTGERPEHSPLSQPHRKKRGRQLQSKQWQSYVSCAVHFMSLYLLCLLAEIGRHDTSLNYQSSGVTHSGYELQKTIWEWTREGKHLFTSEDYLTLEGQGQSWIAMKIIFSLIDATIYAFIHAWKWTVR